MFFDMGINENKSSCFSNRRIPMKKADSKWPIYAIQRKNGISYVAKYRSKEVYLTKTFKRKIDAVNWLKEQCSLTEVNNYSEIQKHANQKVSWLCEYWIENYAKVYKQTSSIIRDQGYVKNWIVPYLGSTRISELNPRQLELWVSQMRKKLSMKTCNDSIGLLKKIFNDAIRWQFVGHNPVMSVTRFKAPEKDLVFWTFEEKAIFLNFMFQNYKNVYPVFLTALLTGMRAGELAGLK